MSAPDPIDLRGVTCYPLDQRASKVGMADFARPWRPGGGLQRWVESLPHILGGRDFRAVIADIAQAVRNHRSVLLAMGAHPIKVGLNPVILDLMERGILTGLALNGAGIIHDAELAMVGRTSEDVSAQLAEGRFGMAEETGRLLNQAAIEGAKRDIGLGRAVGEAILREGFPYADHSLLAGALKRDIPVTVHVAIGTDIIHCHPRVDGAALGKTSHRDFRVFAALLSRLEGGVFINLGSAVVLPEVFLKALSLVRNLGHDVREFTAVNMDFIRHYRPMTNVVDRPTQEGGRGFSLVGQHEIMVPLLAAAVLEELEGG